MKHACACCGFLTMDGPPSGSYDICPVCFWEDDGVQVRDEDFAGGANTPSLNTARRNFARIGAVEERLVLFVREPLPEERPV